KHVQDHFLDRLEFDEERLPFRLVILDDICVPLVLRVFLADFALSQVKQTQYIAISGRSDLKLIHQINDIAGAFHNRTYLPLESLRLSRFLACSASFALVSAPSLSSTTGLPPGPRKKGLSSVISIFELASCCLVFHS